MKRIITALLVLCMLLCLFSCQKSAEPELTGKYEYLNTKLENDIELQKNAFIGKVLSVSEQNALIPKYNIDITTYTVFTVNVTESLDGYTPLGNVQVYWIGAASEFIKRNSLKKNETYVLFAEPWVYADEIVYLLAPYTNAYARLDKAGRVSIIDDDGKAKDCGTLEEYKQSYFDARVSLEQKIPGFFETKTTLERFISIFENVKKVNDNNWFRDFKYDWTPDNEFITKTRDHTATVYNYLISLKNEQNLTDEHFKKIFTI